MAKTMYYTKTCEHCGKQFTAQKSCTRFCSKYCADAANKERLRKWTQGINQASDDERTRIRAPEIMGPKAMADYFSISPRTVYRYLESGLVKALQLPGKTLIRKSDIDHLFDEAEPYKKRERSIPEKKAGLSSSPGIIQEEKGYTTVKESAEKYDLSPAYVDKLFNKSGITVVFHRGKKYYPVSEVNSLFRKREADSHPEIKEWYTCKEIEEKYCLTQGTVRDIVSTRQIPKKNVHGIAYYSKVHFDIARGQASEQTLYYTVKEAMAKFHQTRDQVYNVLRYNNIQRILEGRIVKFRKADYDDCMKFTFKD